LAAPQEGERYDFSGIGQAQSIDGRPKREIRIVHGHRPRNRNLLDSAVPFKGPPKEGSIDSQAILDAIVRGQIIQRARGASAGKILWRADDRNLEGPHDPDCNHVRGDPVSRVDSGVESLADDIHRERVDMHFKFDIGVGREKASPQLSDDRRSQWVAMQP